jgi:hypothetical protein
MHHRSLKLITLALALLPVAARAQEDAADGARQAFGSMQRTTGEITAVVPGKITVKTEDGSAMQVVTTDNTRIMKGRGETTKFADLKPGDGVTAAGNLDAPNKTLHAAILIVVDAAQIKAMKENLGKTYIAGKVTAIDLDNATMTVERADKVAQTIGFDETTSFKRGGRMMMGGAGGGGMMILGGPGGGGARQPREGNGPPPGGGGESITLADIKVGDNVAGQGALKNGVFVPTQLNVMTPGTGQRRQRPGGQGTPVTLPSGQISSPPTPPPTVPPPGV